MATVAAPWWLGDALGIEHGVLTLDGHDLASAARRHGTPVYAYSATTIRRRLGELRAALGTVGVPFSIRYAIKANRFGAVLDVIRAERDIAIDACSPREVERAVAHGFAADAISLNASNLSNRDLDAFVRAGVHVTLDSRSAIGRYGARTGRRDRIGIRVNPELAVGWGESDKLAYAGGKFGFDMDDAVAAALHAAACGLEVDELHAHVGWSIQASSAETLRRAYADLAALAHEIGSVRTINVGGGLGWRVCAADEPLTVSTWAGLVREEIARHGFAIACEPGTYVTASAGVLVCEVTTITERRSGTWVGLDAGHNTNVYPAHYGIPLELIRLRDPAARPTQRYHVAGNINESNDVFARNLDLPDLVEGDLVALYPAGAYGASMASDHCLRGLPAELLIDVG